MHWRCIYEGFEQWNNVWKFRQKTGASAGQSRLSFNIPVLALHRPGPRDLSYRSSSPFTVDVDTRLDSPSDVVL
jgi:hypothetical protein